jgi:hypothetical protein
MPSQASGDDTRSDGRHDDRDQGWDWRDERRVVRVSLALPAANHEARPPVRPGVGVHGQSIYT